MKQKLTGMEALKILEGRIIKKVSRPYADVIVFETHDGKEVHVVTDYDDDLSISQEA